MTTLWDKLNLKEDQEIVVINAPTSFSAALKALPRGRVQSLLAGTDPVHLQGMDR
jgi:hypothetical protein